MDRGRMQCLNTPNTHFGRHPDNESACPRGRPGAPTGGIAVKVDLAGRVAVVSGASAGLGRAIAQGLAEAGADVVRSETSELQSHSDLVCRLLLEKKKKKTM